MGIEEWWPKLKPSTREWLIENNGDAVATEVVAEIAEAVRERRTAQVEGRGNVIPC